MGTEGKGEDRGKKSHKNKRKKRKGTKGKRKGDGERGEDLFN